MIPLKHTSNYLTTPKFIHLGYGPNNRNHICNCYFCGNQEESCPNFAFGFIVKIYAKQVMYGMDVVVHYTIQESHRNYKTKVMRINDHSITFPKVTSCLGNNFSHFIPFQFFIFSTILFHFIFFQTIPFHFIFFQPFFSTFQIPIQYL